MNPCFCALKTPFSFVRPLLGQIFPPLVKNKEKEKHTHPTVVYTVYYILLDAQK